MMWLCELVFSALHDHLWRLFAFLFGVENTKHPPQVTAPIDIRSIETLSAPLMAVPLEMESILTVGLFTLWVSMAGLFLYTSVAKKKAGIAKEETLACFLDTFSNKVENLQNVNLDLLEQVKDHMQSSDRKEKQNMMAIREVQRNLLKLRHRLNMLELENDEEDELDNRKAKEHGLNTRHHKSSKGRNLKSWRPAWMKKTSKSPMKEKDMEGDGKKRTSREQTSEEVEDTKQPPQVTASLVPAPLETASLVAVSAPLMAVPLELDGLLAAGMLSLWVAMVGVLLYTCCLKRRARIAKEDLAAFLKKSLEQVETLQKTNLMLFNQMSDHMASAEKREKLNTKLLKTIQLNMQNLDQRLKRLEEENGEEERNSTQKTEEMFMEMNGYEKRCMEDLHSVKEQLRLRQEQLSHKVGLIKDKEQELEKAGQRLHRTELEARSLEELLKHERVKNMETLEDLEAACQEAKKQLLKSESKSKNLGEKIEDMQYLYSGLQRDVASLEESIKESTCKAQNIKGIDCTLMKGKKEPRGPKEDKEAGLRGLEELKGEMRLLEKTSKTK